MALWINEKNEIHDDMDGEALELPSWPAGLRKLGEEEAAALRVVEWSPDALLGKFRDARETVLNRLAGIWIFSTSDEVKSACSSARAALLSLPESKGVVSAKDDASLKLAILAAYKEIVSAAPDALKNAFSELD